MTLQERIELLQEAKYNLQLTIENLTEALQNTTEEDHAFSYIIPHLQNWLGEEGSSSYNTGIEDYIKLLRKAYETENY